MAIHDITEDSAELLATLVEALLYGFSLLMFVGTIWTLVSHRSTVRVNRKMFVVACALLVFSTAHLVIDIIRVIQGFVLYRDIFPGGPLGYFSDVSQWTFVWKNYIYTAQTLTGDAVVLYRCYVAWESKLIMVLPLLLWCAVAVTGIVAPFIASRAGGNKIYDWCLWEWITSFYASTLVTNLVATCLLVFRIWCVDRQATRVHGLHESRLRPLLHVVMDAGVVYSLSLIAALICFSSRTNGQFVLLNMIAPIISITFYMVIIRVGLANRTGLSMNVTVPPRCSLAGNARATVQESSVRAIITTTTDPKFDAHQSSSSFIIIDKTCGRDSECALNDIGNSV